METPPSPIPNAAQVADSPFHKGAGNTVLRSSDLVDFYVNEWALANASPIFRNMLSLPQPTDAPSSLCRPGTSTPIVSMAEDAASLRMFLEFCYPRTICPEPVIDSLADVKRCLTLSTKFDVSIMKDCAGAYLVRLTETHPETAYLIAWAYEMRDHVLRAACATLYHPFLSHAGISELSEVSAVSIANLYQFRAACYDDISSLKDPTNIISWISESDIWLDPTDPDKLQSCDAETDILSLFRSSEEEELEQVKLRHWWWDFVSHVVDGVRAARDFKTVANEARQKSFQAILACPACRAGGIDVIERTNTALKLEIEKRVSQVPLAMSF